MRKQRSGGTFSFFLGIFFLVLTGASLVSDFISGEGALILRPLGQYWFEVSPNSLQLIQPAIERYLHPYLWDPLIQSVLTWPAAMVFGGLTILFFASWFIRRLRAA